MFLAAKSLWMKFFSERYFMPEEISLQNRRRVCGVSGEMSLDVVCECVCE